MYVTVDFILNWLSRAVIHAKQAIITIKKKTLDAKHQFRLQNRVYREKRKRYDLVLLQKPLHQQKCQRGKLTTQKRHQNVRLQYNSKLHAVSLNILIRYTEI